METFKTIGLFQIHPEQRARFTSERLWEGWAAAYPQLFDEDDVRIARSQAHLGYHYYEWLAAILLYHAWGYLSLVEQFEFRTHERKQSIVRRLVTADVMALMTDKQQYGQAQCPDLLVYKPDLSEWFFCEIKGPRDRLSPKQEEYFQALAQVSGRPIRMIQFRMTDERRQHMSAPSLLAFIVPKLVIQAENAVSDCLCFILSTYSGTAMSLANYLEPTGVALPTPLEFTPQIMWQHTGARPDILGMHGKQPYLVIESKFDAPLTKGQPVDYIQYLPADAGGVLLFIAPERRVEELWLRFAKRSQAARVHLGSQVEAPNGLRFAQLGTSHTLAMATWEDLIPAILHDLSPDTDPAAHADVTQLQTLCQRLVSGELPDSPALQSAEETDRRDRQLREVADAIVARLVQSKLATTKGYRSTPGPGYYKRYMTLSGRINWCVEFNTEYWARFGQSLIWLTTTMAPEAQADYARLRAGLKGTTHTIRDQLLIPLRVDVHSQSEPEVIEHMALQAITVGEWLAGVPTESMPAC